MTSLGKGSDRSYSEERARGRTIGDVDADVFELLAHRRRVQLLRCCRERGPDLVDLDDLTECVHRAELEAGEPASWSDVRLSLHHAHLPKLAERGVVEYDADDRNVRYLGSVPFERALDVLSDS